MMTNCIFCNSEVFVQKEFYPAPASDIAVPVTCAICGNYGIKESVWDDFPSKHYTEEEKLQISAFLKQFSRDEFTIRITNKQESTKTYIQWFTQDNNKLGEKTIEEIIR